MIIAVDFDGILAEDNGKFPEIGPPVYPMISFVQDLIDAGHEVVLWTSRTDKALENAVLWCENWGLKFCAVNENAPSNVAKFSAQYPNGTRKVSADVYIDDHSPHFMHVMGMMNHESAIHDLIYRTKEVLRWKEEN